MHSVVDAMHITSGFEAKKAKQLAFHVDSAGGASHITSGFEAKKAKQLAFS